MKQKFAKSKISFGFLTVIGLAAAARSPAGPLPTTHPEKILLQWSPTNSPDQLPYLQQVEWKRTGRQLEVTIEGNLPDAGHVLETTEAELFGRLIVLFPRIKSGPGLAAQVLRPFKTTLNLELPDELALTLCVVGRTGTRVESIDAASSTVFELGIKNARLPTPGVLTGGQLSEEQMSRLARLGYRNFVSLRPATELGAGWEEAFAEKHGLRFTRIPVAGADGVTKANASRLAQVLSANPPLHAVYCASGNRVGALFALKARFVDGENAEDSLQIGKEAGLTRLEPTVKAMLDL